MSMIRIHEATKRYGENKGIFQMNLEIPKGVVFGLLGPNGAGKTTTIRHLLGFSKLDSGSMELNGMNTWRNAAEAQSKLGYLPGEISFPENLTGMEFIQYIGRLRCLKSYDKANDLLKYFEIDPSAKLKKMSKGMKQKIAIVVAFMHDPEVVILDEPTSGLDPLMQEKFVQLIAREKKLGKTILLSSHMFDEIERTCDEVAILKQGRLVTRVAMNDIRTHRDRVFEVGFHSVLDCRRFQESGFSIRIIDEADATVIVELNDDQINRFLSEMSKYPIRYLKEDVYTLEKHFMQFYGKEA